MTEEEKQVLRQQNYWLIESPSQNVMLPTNKEDSIRGMRGKNLYIDDAMLTDKQVEDILND